MPPRPARDQQQSGGKRRPGRALAARAPALGGPEASLQPELLALIRLLARQAVEDQDHAQEPPRDRT